MWASNTYFLEQCLGWRGLCIEPNPVHHERIRAERKCTLVPNCVSDAAKTIEMILPDGFHGGAARVVKEQRDLAVGWGKKPVQMECRTLRSILHEHKVKHIDFMSLDIEGHEPEAMSTLKLDHGGEHGVTIDVVSAETNSSAAYWRAGNYRHYSPKGMEQVFLRPGYQMPIEEAGKPILWPAEVPTCSAELKAESKARSMDPVMAAAIRAKEARAKAKLLKGASRVSPPSIGYPRVSPPSRLGLRAEM
jgi:FkbM family methyltransferase